MIMISRLLRLSKHFLLQLPQRVPRVRDELIAD